MLAHSLLSGALLLLPVAVTLAIYIGVNVQQLFHSGFKGSYGIPTFMPKFGTNTYCQKSIGITPQNGRYTYNPNQWGLGANQASAMCMNITTSSNVSSTDTAAAPFAATWQYPPGPDTQPVHAFPNAKLDSATIPILLSNFDTFHLDVNWHYAVGNDNATISPEADITAAGLNANVCVDMFFATDKTLSQSTTNSTYEVMVWLGQYGPATQPIGLKTGAVLTATVNGTVFNLYSGTNSLNQKVFTWVAAQNTNRFVGDIGPLFDGISTNGGPQSSDYLGYVSFGSEAYFSPTNVTFSVAELAMVVNST